MARYRIRLIGDAEISARIRHPGRRRWVATILHNDKTIGGFGYLPVAVLTGDLAGRTAQGRVTRSLGKRLRIKGVQPFVASAPESFGAAP